MQAPVVEPAAEPVPVTVWEFEAIGTQWWIALYEKLDEAELAGLRKAIDGRIARFDHTYSRFRDDSMVASMAVRAGSYTIPNRGRDMLRLYRQLYDLTGGAMTPLIGQLLADAGYDASYSLQPQTMQPVPAWDEVLDYHDGVLTLKQPALLDFGALGKGCLVDMVARMLRGAGLEHFCVDAGGDMAYLRPDHRPALRVGLEHPDDPGQIIGVAVMPSESGMTALCGSAGNRRAWAGLHHIMDPRKLQPTSDIKAVWVAASNAMLADGLATALFFEKPPVLARHFAFEWLIMEADNRVSYSRGFPAVLFSE